MIFSEYIKKSFFVLCVLMITTASSLPAFAVNVQIFKALEEGVSSKDLRAEAVSQAFAQALMSESVRMIPATLSAERSNALKDMFTTHYEEFITGYRDMDVKFQSDGVAVRIDVNVNRSELRAALKRMGLFSDTNKSVKADISVSSGKVKLSESEQAGLDADLQKLMVLFGIQKVVSTEPSIPKLNLTQVSKNRWNGDLVSAHGKWNASGRTVETVWNSLWAKYFNSENVQSTMNPKIVLVVNGWFNPDGVQEFDRMLKSWDSAVQEVKLLDVEMKPTAVSASWSLEVSDQWVLKSYLNDYLPSRGLSFNLDGLSGDK
ncbi:hypothetical protein [Desulfovibrio gilichinskyi]|uniref:Lipoprotein n=1 Tax=Desulfovibrio gilichinskyi TaxID=1519643 RepID=A0A1X7C6I3_9BACT|nr:hypothetical protein [Desulfovibrio gilichinskyi]SME90869.1 hypothetical protein SAMN06295933_0411 [Desulfovibrio gilichinskyi]